MAEPAETSNSAGNSGANSEFNNSYFEREKGDWKSRYPDEAQKIIIWEMRYLITLLCVFLAAPLLFGVYICGCFSTIPHSIFESFPLLKTYIFGWFGGTLGGIAFCMKWLYHGVAKNIWHCDRHLWRVFTPHLSGILALAVIVLLNNNLVASSSSSYNFHKAYGVGFLIGYFSDNALGKLTEMANVLFSSKK